MRKCFANARLTSPNSLDLGWKHTVELCEELFLGERTFGECQLERVFKRFHLLGTRVRRHRFLRRRSHLAQRQSHEAGAKAILQPLNSHAYAPEATQTLGQFVETVYFPTIVTQKRVSTVKDYKARWAFQLKPRCESFRLRDFRTSNAQRLLAEIARENPHLGRVSLHHLRSLQSGMFKHAISRDT